MREHRGMYLKEDVDVALRSTRMTRTSKNWCVKYLVDGFRLKDLPTSKQNAYIKIKRAVKALEEKGFKKVNKSVDDEESR